MGTHVSEIVFFFLLPQTANNKNVCYGVSDCYHSLHTSRRYIVKCYVYHIAQSLIVNTVPYSNASADVFTCHAIFFCVPRFGIARYWRITRFFNI